MKPNFLLTIALFSTTSIACAQGGYTSDDATDALTRAVNNSNKQNVVIEIVDRPSLPKTLTFASESVPLEQESVREWLTNELLVTKYMHSKTSKSLLLAGKYFDMIEEILREEGVPEDFKYLCVAESGLDPNAYSSAGAAGLWQIMKATGTEYGLEVGSTVDERYHVEKSTRVACTYLKNAYKKFGNWTMAAASYNVGMAGVSRRAATQQVDNYYELFLPTETMRYVYRILTYKMLFEDPKSLAYNITPDDAYNAASYKDVEISDAAIDWVALAKEHGTTYKAMRELNPWIREYKHTNKSGKKYVVKMPTSL